ncbi:sigma E regulatory protein, MucB/RseB [Modestobacter sp. DSM 44400]|nr:sigma E regulatory protein, MucB/RseB [Modestobacter sp. DSM 44400]
MVAAVAVLLALPALIGALPASDAGTSAPDLRDRALASSDVAFTGYAQAAGGLTLPVGDQLTSVADLLSDRTTMRAWYRAPDDWRVDVVSATGETGVHRDASGTWTWRYEDDVASRAAALPLSLPTAPDLLPSVLGRRLLSEAADGELSRLGAERVAGRDALGLRITPSDAAASVSRVDVWVDAESGIPLGVQVSGGQTGGGEPAVDTSFLSLDLVTPAASVTAFTPPPGADVRRDQQQADLLDTGRQYAAVQLPATLAGLPGRAVDGTPGAVGVYGRGVTLLAVSVLPGRAASPLRDTLVVAPGAVVDDLGVRIAAGPLGLMLVDNGNRGTWLLAGTVDLDALATAAAELPAPPRRGDR